MLTRWLAIIGLVVLLALGMTAAQEATVPTLTETQKLQLQTLSLQLEVAQLKAQLAQKDFDAARLEITRLLQSLQVPGYTLDVAALTYRPTPPPEQKE